MLEKSKGEVSVKDLKTSIIAQLDPSVMEYENEEIDLLIELIIMEYFNRYQIDCQIWNDFMQQRKEGKLI